MTALTALHAGLKYTRRDALFLCVAVSFVFFLGGCATSSVSPTQNDPWASSIGHGPVGSSHAGDSASATKELATATRMVQAGEFSLVIPRLQQIISKYPGDPKSVEARYYLGHSYYAVGAYNDALRYLNEYIELDPDGTHAGTAKDVIAQLTDDKKDVIPAALDVEAAALTAKIADSPDDMALQLELANLYWENGRYEEAGPVYADLLQRWPMLAEDIVVKRRVERTADGQITVLTPLEVERRHRETEPLLVYNTSAFKSGRFEGWPATGHQRYYNVTGQAVNQSGSQINNVTIVVTIYGSGYMVYDTRTVSIGSLRPGETRAFSVQFSQFENIDNIARYECVGTFRR
jgi:tetratricopeptide (TPR) repeat protein